MEAAVAARLRRTTGLGGDPADRTRSARLEQAVEQLVLADLELHDRRRQLGPVAGHRVGVTLRLAVLAVGQRASRT